MTMFIRTLGLLAWLFATTVSAQTIDTDGDGFTDTEELEAGSDPNSAASIPQLSSNLLLYAYLITSQNTPSEPPVVVPEPEPEQSALEHYTQSLESQLVQAKCVACHVSGGVASTARLLFESGSNKASSNFSALENFLSLSNVSADYILNKVRGVGHGGGTQLSSTDQLYQELSTVLIKITDCSSCKDNIIPSGIEGVTMMSSRQILRKASVLLAGRYPTEPEYSAFESASDAQKVAQLKDAFTGDEFKLFIKNGANDRLLFRGLQNGIEFHILHGYKQYTNFYNVLETFKKQAENSEIDSSVPWEFQYTRVIPSAIEEPLELIAHVVLNDKPYSEILTADYTMVSPYTDVVYQSGIDFGVDVVKDFQNLRQSADHVYDYKPGVNRGQAISMDNVVTEDPSCPDFQCGKVLDVPDGHLNYPHAGLLNSLAFLDRYPNTETNRNRARSRWVYYHFLGVDIERSAPRSQKQEDLTDPNNPTMNNPACSVCHEIMDPVAGAFQNYGVRPSIYRSESGLHSLPWTYISPPDGSPSSFQPGDLWYRDMRTPAFNGETVATPETSLQWLAQKIIKDPRFPKATVEFWWPAVMGQEVLRAPEVSTDADFAQKLANYELQQSAIKDIAEKFSASGLNLKVMLAEMVMTPWFSGQAVEEGTNPESLPMLGRGQMLTPEKLSRKVRAIRGRSWLQVTNGLEADLKIDALNSEWQFGSFMGAIDSFFVTDRPRDFNVSMYNVMYKQAAELVGGDVAQDFVIPDGSRKIMQGIDVTTQPINAASEQLIKQKLQDLLFIFWGDEISQDHPEFQRVYGLLKDLYNHRKQNNINNLHNERFSYLDENGWWGNPTPSADCNCNPADDSTFMKGTWAGVVRYLMTHPKFVFE